MSEIKVNKISPRTNCGTVTLGDSGDTFTIPSGATITNAGTASGFGATGETSWDTTVKTTGTFTATTGVGYFLNTTGGIITVNLPVGAAGSSVALADYAGTWQTSNVTVTPNGSEKIGGQGGSVTLDTEGQSVTFVYVDGTQGWVNVIDSTSNVRSNPFVTATGGCITTSGDYKIHKFIAPGTFCVSNAGSPGGSTTVDYILVAGGGGGGGGCDRAGAGGAGGFKGSSGAASGCYAAGCAPIVGPVAAQPVSTSPGAYAIVIGGGGAGRPPGPPQGPGTVGDVSSAFGITVAGGGYGAGSPNVGGDGGSGGGGGFTSGPGGSGNTPPLTPSQGNDGSAAAGGLALGAGGGISNCGGAATPTCAGDGGQDINNSITGSPVYYAGGGGGGGQNPGSTQGSASPGGSGGAGGLTGGAPPHNGFNGPDNHGGGGGGASNRTGGHPAAGGNGGSGVVIIRYKYQ